MFQITLTLCRPTDFSIEFDTVKSGWYIAYISRGPRELRIGKKWLESCRNLDYILSYVMYQKLDTVMSGWNIVYIGRGPRELKIGKKLPESSRILDYILS